MSLDALLHNLIERHPFVMAVLFQIEKGSQTWLAVYHQTQNPPSLRMRGNNLFAIFAAVMNLQLNIHQGSG